MMTVAPTPDWLVAEMPPGYQTRFAEIQRLSAEMHAMDRMARLLWESGPALHEAVGDAFDAMKYEVESPAADPSLLIIKLEHKRRLLVHVAETDAVIEKKSPELALVFRLVHELAADEDRTVLVTSGDRTVPPKARGAAVTPEAEKLLARLGVNVMPASTLFGVWSLAQQEPARARAYLDKFHAMDGGMAPAAKA
jgi:hypothetical protein